MKSGSYLAPIFGNSQILVAKLILPALYDTTTITKPHITPAIKLPPTIAQAPEPVLDDLLTIYKEKDTVKAFLDDNDELNIIVEAYMKIRGTDAQINVL